MLETETKRLEEMARSFALFGRLPEGPRAPVDVGELVRSATRSAVPAETPVEVSVAEDVPMIAGHVDALGRALTNVLLNAVEASTPGAPVEVTVRRRRAGWAVDGRGGGARSRRAGSRQNRLGRIWEPYVTHKPGGTGLGLAIVRQTLLAHDGVVSAESATGAGTTIRLFLPAGTSGITGG